MDRPLLTLNVLWTPLAVVHLKRDAKVPAWAFDGEFVSVRRDEDELSIICDAANAKGHGVGWVDASWRAIRLDADFEQRAEASATIARAIGAACLSAVEGEDGILFVKDDQLTDAVVALERAGFRVEV